MTLVSVIVPFRDARESLEGCLEGLSRQRHGEREVILVDNLSRDGSRDLAQRWCRLQKGETRALVTREDRPGAAAARNRGASLARGELLAFTDADCIPSPAWLEEAIGAFDDPALAAVAGNLKGCPPVGRIEAFHNLCTLQGREREEIHGAFLLTHGGFPAANLVVRKNAFEAVGGFDESLTAAGEDYDFCARLYAAGWRIKAIPRALVLHRHRRTLAGTWRQAFGYGEAHARLLDRHLGDCLILEAGKFTCRKRGFPRGVWIQATTAEKKFLALLLLGAFGHPLLWGMLPLFLLILMNDMGRRAEAAALRVTRRDAAAMAGLLLFKSLAMTAGRIRGAWENRVFCL